VLEGAVWGVLRDLAKERRGKRIGWSDIQAAFRAKAPDAATLDTVFGQWLDGTERPDLTLERVENAENGRWRFVIRQHTVTPFILPITVDVRRGDEVETRELLIREGETIVEMDPPEKGAPWSVEVEPDAHVLRRLMPEEITPCLGATLSDEKIAVALPGANGDEKGMEAYRAIARSFGDREGLVVFEGGEIDLDVLTSRSLLVLGTDEKNPLITKLSENPLGDGDLILGDRIRYRDASGAMRDLPEDADLLVTVPSPYAPGRFVTLYIPGSDLGVRRARLIFRYRWDSQVVFEKGRATLKILRATGRNRCLVSVGGKSE